jgi:uncharacterized protein
VNLPSTDRGPAAPGANRAGGGAGRAAAGPSAHSEAGAHPSLRGWALITGACSGIGLEIARELGRRGYPLLLVSDREEALCTAAGDLASAYGVATQFIRTDLARPEAAGALHEEILRRGLEIEVLVSNAGILLFGEVANTDPERANTLLQLHVVTPSLLATYFSGAMRARRRGYILFVSSISANRPLPGIAFYGSSKSYLRSFATALHDELRPWGVGVTCVLPGAVATNLYSNTRAPVEKAVRWRVMVAPADVARAAVQGMFAGRATVVPGFSAKLMSGAMRLTPRSVIRLIRDHTDLLDRPPR